ncbi:diguanylate cyclase [Mitsuaria sp. GD03876]|uniref:diguanylate cyclase n=1 Tax=Mitsuaria sp. GD03876 TaxID=2975399 RepID=UPI002448004E|nr:diguanylate cyclase [Mitsuaria sp. GD03876]MDH0863095.1 diguanylate cyclase [Mitsuaria sp. GD03876]
MTDRRAWEAADPGAWQAERTLHQGRRSEIVQVGDGRGGTALLKRLRDPRADPAATARLRREFELAQRLDAAFVLRPRALVEHDGRPALLLPELGAETLRHRLRRGTLGNDELIQLALDLVDGLQHLHGLGLIHRNLGPGQVLLLPGAGHEPARTLIADLGLAAEIERERPLVQRAELIEASLATLAPELTGRMSRDVDYRADFYSLGATLLEALTGAPPFSIEDPARAVHAHLALAAPMATTRNHQVFAPLAQVVAHCLHKEPEGRYQSHQALRHDLQLCQAALRQGRALPGFEAGHGDAAVRFQPSGRLYGRESAQAQLGQAFDDAATGHAGGSGLVAVAGFSGIGKTALVLAAQRSLLAQRGHFAAAKFNQYGQDRPYGPLLHLLQQRAAQVLALPAPQQAVWRERLDERLGANAALLAQALPEMAPLLALDAPLVPVGPAEAENRFLRSVSQGFAALAREGEPQTLFLDDWQWADRASRRLLRECLNDATLRHTLFVLAYRDNETPPGHPIAQELSELRQQLGERFTPLRIGPLGLDDTRHLLADSLHRDPAAEDVGLDELARLCQTRTAGNPFFLRRLLEDLVRRGLIHYDAAAQRWDHALERIAATRTADNVVALMLQQLERLPDATRQALSVAALLGAGFGLDSLAMALDEPADALATALLPALQAQLLVPASALYRYAPQLQGQASESVRYAFAHDRVQEAALQRIAADQRPALQLRIGRLLRDGHRAAQPDLPLPYTVLHHLNASRMLLREPHHEAERQALAGYNAQASFQAMDAAAFEPAADYAELALELAPCSPQRAAWLHHAARMAYLAGRPSRMDALLESALADTTDNAQRARLLEVRMEAFYAQGRLADTVDLGLELFLLLGAELPRAGGPDAMAKVMQLLAGLQQEIAAIGLDTLAERAPMRDEQRLLLISIAAKMTAAAYIVRPALLPLLTLFQVRLMVDHGHVPQALSAYSVLGLMCAEFLGDYRFAHDLGRMSTELVSRHGWMQVFAHAGFSFHAFLSHWVQGLRVSMDGLMQTHRNGLEFGNLRHAGLGLYVHDAHAFLAGTPLPALEEQLVTHGRRLRAMRQPVAADYEDALLGLVRTLRQPALPEDGFDGQEALARTYGERQDQTGLMFLHGWQAVLHFVADRPEPALRLAKEARALFAAGRGMHAQSLLLFIAAWAAQRVALAGGTRDLALEDDALQRLERWRDAGPGHLHDRVALLRAQRAMLDGAPAAEIDDGLERALAAAQGPLGTPLDAAAVLRAQADWWRERAPERADAARAGLLRAWKAWGVTALAGETLGTPLPLDVHGAPVGETGPAGEIRADAADLSTLTKAVQAISSQPDLPRLLRRLLEVVAENAGAQRAAIVLANGAAGATRWVLQAEATLGEQPRLHLLEQLPLERAGQQLPLALMGRVLRDGRRELIADARGLATMEDYFQQQSAPPRSVLALPLLKQGQTVGALYLENAAAAGVFTEARVSFLELLCANVVNAVDNARLVAELQELNASLERRVAQRTRELADSEERLRAVLDHAPIPMVVTREHDALIVYANQPSADIAGRTLDDLVGKPAISFYRDPQDRDRMQQKFRQEGRLQGEELCLLAADGSELWILLSQVPVNYDGAASVLSTLVDFTDRKRLELELQRLATTDALTGAANRRSFLEHAEAEVARSRRYGLEMALVMMDVDHFKRINDTLGHARGDAALCRLVQLCAQIVRKQDLLGRLGGEEFGLLLPQTSLEDASHLVERLRHHIETSGLELQPGSPPATLTASFGVTALRPEDLRVEELLGRADQALYRAKDGGRNRVERQA